MLCLSLASAGGCQVHIPWGATSGERALSPGPWPGRGPVGAAQLPACVVLGALDRSGRAEASRGEAGP